MKSAKNNEISIKNEAQDNCEKFLVKYESKGIGINRKNCIIEAKEEISIGNTTFNIFNDASIKSKKVALNNCTIKVNGFFHIEAVNCEAKDANIDCQSIYINVENFKSLSNNIEESQVGNDDNVSLSKRNSKL